MSWWRLKNNHNQRISILLILALLSLTILPAHFHLHHPAPDDGHGLAHRHVVDLHVYSVGVASHHQDAQVLKASPDGVLLLKNPLFKLSVFLLLAVIAALSAITLLRSNLNAGEHGFIPSGRFGYLSPPLYTPKLSLQVTI